MSFAHLVFDKELMLGFVYIEDPDLSSAGVDNLKSSKILNF